MFFVFAPFCVKLQRLMFMENPRRPTSSKELKPVHLLPTSHSDVWWEFWLKLLTCNWMILCIAMLTHVWWIQWQNDWGLQGLPNKMYSEYIANTRITFLQSFIFSHFWAWPFHKSFYTVIISWKQLWLRRKVTCCAQKPNTAVRTAT